MAMPSLSDQIFESYARHGSLWSESFTLRSLVFGRWDGSLILGFVVRPLGLVPIQETQVCAYMIARLDEA